MLTKDCIIDGLKTVLTLFPGRAAPELLRVAAARAREALPAGGGSCVGIIPACWGAGRKLSFQLAAPLQALS